MATAAALIQRSPRLRNAVRALARLLNPIVLQVAGRRWMPIVGIVRHRGRRTGRLYATPLGMRPLGRGLVIPRTFGPDAAWYRNLLAAGSVDAIYRGEAWHLGAPRLGDLASVAPSFPRYERVMFRLLGIDDFVILDVVLTAAFTPAIGYLASGGSGERVGGLRASCG